MALDLYDQAVQSMGSSSSVPGRPDKQEDHERFILVHLRNLALAADGVALLLAALAWRGRVAWRRRRIL